MQELMKYLNDLVNDTDQYGDLRTLEAREARTKSQVAETVLRMLSDTEVAEDAPTSVNLPAGLASLSFYDCEGDDVQVHIDDDLIVLDSIRLRNHDHEAIDTLCGILQALKR